MIVDTGTGGNPSLGEQAAEESASTIGTAVGNADMVRSLRRPAKVTVVLLLCIAHMLCSQSSQQMEPAIALQSLHC